MSEHETHEVIVSICGPVPDWCRCEIVRCRDCRWAKPDHSDHEYRGEYKCNMWIADVDAYGFCFRAIRREGESLEVWNQWSADDITCSEES